MPYPRLTKCMPDESRHNPFHVLHKALRFGHCRILCELSTGDFAAPEASAQMMKRLSVFLQVSRAVSAAQDRLPLPASDEAIRDVTGQRAALGEIESLMRAVSVAAPQRRAAAGRALYRAYALFAAADMGRMDAEETSLLARLHQAATDETLRSWEAELFRAMPPDQFEALLRLMLPALAPLELEAVLADFGGDSGPQRFADFLQNAVRPLLAGSSSAAA